MPSELPPYLSPSSISTFEQCPLKYKLTRIDKLSEPPTEATLLGNFVHEVLENFYVLPAEFRTISEIKQISSKVWETSEWRYKVEPILGQNQNIKTGKSNIETELNSFRWKSWFCIENIFSIEDPLSVNPSGIEHELNGKVEGVQIKGFIDRWSQSEHGIVISDYKTGKSPSPRFMDDKFMQLLIYALVLGEEQNLPIDELQLLYVKDNKILKMNPEEKHLVLTAKRIRSVWDGVVERCESDIWETIPHRLCDWCTFKKTICPQWNTK